jgi:hypothetical protein
MSNKNKEKNTARRQTEAGRRAVFDFGVNFWAGAPGWVLIILMTLIGILVIAFSYYQGHEGQRGEIVVNKNTEQQTSQVLLSDDSLLLDGPRSAVDGRLLTADDSTEYFAVLIDNYVAARPVAGVVEASLIIEAPVEGGITRFLSVFSDDSEWLRIGPVRSARPYFVDWAREYDAVLVHVGGSPTALKMLEAADTNRDLNEMLQGGYFWRDRQRSSPHNVYTSSELLHESFDELSERAETVENDRLFKQSNSRRPSSASVFKKIIIDYSVPAYFVTWEYDEDNNVYVRWQGGRLVVDEKEQAVTADNVIIQFTDIKTIDSLGRKEIRTLGAGEALVMRDGRSIKAQWKKESSGRTHFMFSGAEKEIPLNIGKTWIQVVALDTSVHVE